MFNQLNIKKQAFGGRKTEDRRMSSLAKCWSICNFLEATLAHCLQRAPEHSSDRTCQHPLGLYSAEALLRSIFPAEKHACIVLFYPKYLLAVAPPTFSTREEHSEQNAAATSCYNVLFIGLFNIFPWALVTLPES